jgi:hypothetical protein
MKSVSEISLIKIKLSFYMQHRYMKLYVKYIMYLLILTSILKLPISVNGAFSRSAKLIAADGGVNDQFGNSVSIYGANAIIGAVSDDDKATDAGILYKHY